MRPRFTVANAPETVHAEKHRTQSVCRVLTPDEGRPKLQCERFLPPVAGKSSPPEEMWMRDTWENLGTALAARYARSSWRLPLLLIAGSLAFLAPLYCLRGVRLVRIGVLGVAGALGAAVAFVYPFQTLCAAIFLGFSQVGTYLPAGSFFAIPLLLAVARAVVDWLDGARLDLGTSSFGLSLALLLACALTSLVVVQAPGHAAEQGMLLLKGLLAYVAISQLAATPARIVAIIVVLASGLGVATLVVLRGLVAASGLQLLALAAEARFGGIRGDPNVQAAFANCMLPLLVALLGRARGGARLGVVLLILLMIATVVLSQSRAGMLLLGLLLVGLLLRARRARGYLVAGMLVLATVALLLPRAYWVRFVSIGQLRGIVVDRSLQVRQHALEGGWQLLQQHPWFGVGLGNFGDHAPRFMLGRYLAHNSFLEVGATLGVVGGLAYLALLGAGWHMARRAADSWGRAGRRTDQALAEGIGIALLAFCGSALTLSIPFYLIVWILLGLANAARRAAAASPGGPAPGCDDRSLIA